MVFVKTPYLWIRRKIEGIEGNRLIREREIRRNTATIVLANFYFAYAIAYSIGFERVAPVRKGAVDDSRFRILFMFSHF